MELDYLFWIRILHLLLAIILAYGPIVYFSKKQIPRIWYTLVLLLAFAAFGYHGYRLIMHFYE